MDKRSNRYEKKSGEKSGVMAFLDKQGIYIIMLVCLAIIGVTAYFTLGNDVAEGPQPTPTGQTVGNNQGQTLDDAKKSPTPKPSAIAPTPKPSSTVEPSPTTPAVTPSPSVKPTASTKPTVMLLSPVTGTIIREYSPDQPVFYATLNEWYVHMGVDIAADANTDVVAALDGTVQSVTNDPELGYTVTISHGDNKVTVYGNLASMDGVSEGDKVSRGDVIGKVGQSAVSTKTEQAHVHFEYRINDESVNPLEYMEK